jgi:hypothetical protein
MLDAIDGLDVKVDEYKNDVHCLGIVFIYIQLPGIKIEGINEKISV